MNLLDRAPADWKLVTKLPVDDFFAAVHNNPRTGLIRYCQPPPAETRSYGGRADCLAELARRGYGRAAATAENVILNLAG